MATQDYKKFSDEELIQRYVERDENVAFAHIYKRYAHLVYGVCMKYLKDIELAKEAVQQIFIKLIEDLKNHDITHFKAWLYTVARNHCLMQLRKDDKTVNKDFTDEDVEFEDDWHHKIRQEYFLTELEAAVKELSKEQRICIRHFYLDNMSYAEVARQTNYNVKQVKSAIQNGKRNLKIKLQALRKEKA